MRIFSYLRVSGLGQVEKDGPVRQREAISEFCTRHGLTSVAEFSEDGVTGALDGMDRPAFGDMITKVELFRAEPLLEVCAIVVENMDRLARDLMVSEFLLKACRDRNIKVFCTDQGELIDMANAGDNPTRVMLRQILGAIAQWDKSVTVRKLRGARVRMRLAGFRCEGAKPYGFFEREKIVMSRISHFKNKGYSFENIAIELNAEGFRTRYKKQWSKSGVHSVFTGRRYSRK